MHFLTFDILKIWSNAGLESTVPSVAFHSGVMEGCLLNLAEDRIALMDETGLDVQVLSLTTPALHDLGSESVGLARRSLAATVARYPTRFEAMATLPMAVPDVAALELERCVKTLGFKGTLLCGKVGKRQGVSEFLCVRLIEPSPIS